MKKLKLVIVFMLLTTTMTMCKTEHKREQQTKVGQIGSKWKKKITITREDTGYISGSYGWTPSVYFYVRRVSNESSNEYIDVETVFIDSATNAIISRNKYQFTPHHLSSKQFLFKSSKYYKSIGSSEDIKAKIYINDELAKILTVRKEDFYKNKL